MFNESLYLRIKDAIAKALNETLHPYWSDKDRHVTIRNIDITSKLKDFQRKAENYFREFMEVVNEIRSARNATARNRLLPKLIQIMQQCNQTAMPKSNNIGLVLDDFGREHKGKLFQLNDKCWDLKNKIYQIKYDMAEEVLKLKKEFPDLDIRGWLREDKRSIKNHPYKNDKLFPRKLTFYKESEYNDRYADFHLPVKIDDFIENDYDVLCGEPIWLRDTENRKIKTPKWGKPFLDTKDEEIKELQKQHKVRDLIDNGQLILNKNNWDLPAIAKLKGYYTPVKDAMHSGVYLLTNKKHKPIIFEEYEFTDEGGILLFNGEYMVEITPDGKIKRDYI